MIAYIPVSDSELAIIDLEDAPKVLDYRLWCKTARYYAHTRIPKSGRPGTRLLMHKLLCPGQLVDHINGDGLDNRKSNLRPSSKRLNSFNLKKAAGVSYCNKRKKYRAHITHYDKFVDLGYFDTEESARAAREIAFDKVKIEMQEWVESWWK